MFDITQSQQQLERCCYDQSLFLLGMTIWSRCLIVFAPCVRGCTRHWRPTALLVAGPTSSSRSACSLSLDSHVSQYQIADHHVIRDLCSMPLWCTTHLPHTQLSHTLTSHTHTSHTYSPPTHSPPTHSPPTHTPPTLTSHTLTSQHTHLPHTHLPHILTSQHTTISHSSGVSWKPIPHLSTEEWTNQHVWTKQQ